ETFSDPRARAPGRSRTPSLLRACRTAISRLRDSRLAYRASALELWFRRLASTLLSADPCAWPPRLAAAVRQLASPSRRASHARSAILLRAPASSPAGRAEHDRNTWRSPCRSPPHHLPGLSPRFSAAAAPS